MENTKNNNQDGEEDEDYYDLKEKYEKLNEKYEEMKRLWEFASKRVNWAGLSRLGSLPEDIIDALWEQMDHKVV